MSHFTLASALLLGLLGFGVGVLGTLVGAGGGFILTPVLLVLYPGSSPQLITAISLAVVFFNAASGSAAYLRQRRVDVRSGALFAACALPASVVGVLLADRVSRPTFDAIMGAALAALAVWLLAGGGGDRGAAPDRGGRQRTIVDRDGRTYRYRPRTGLGAVSSLLVGFASSFLGIGGGVVHVPLLVGVLGFPTHVATATSHFVLAFMALVATLVHVASGSFRHGVGVRRAAALSVGVIAGAQVGAWLSRRFSGRAIRRLLALALLALGLRLIVSFAL